MCIRDRAKEGISPEQGGLRLGVQGGGCSGLSYNIRFDTQPRERDRIFQYGDAVSYTHLDVYKRQTERCNIREPLRKVNESIEAVLKRIKISHMREEPEEAGRATVKPAELVTIV